MSTLTGQSTSRSLRVLVAWAAPFSSYRSVTSETGVTFFLTFEAIQMGAFRSGEH